MAKKKVKKKILKNKLLKDPIKLGRPHLDAKEKTVRLGVCLPESVANQLKKDGEKYGGYGVIIRQAIMMMYDV